MLSILDRYILGKYLGTFFMLLLLFIPIGITVNLAEKIDKMFANNVPLIEVVYYYIDFTVYFANLLFPILLFLSVIWFTSKLAGNSEIVALLSSGMSFGRFLRPYIIGASLVCIGALTLSMYLAPAASQGFNDFKYNYLKSDDVQETKDIYRQINDNEFIYASYFDPDNNTARNFTLEHFEGNTLKFKIKADELKFNPQDSSYTLEDYSKRIIGKAEDRLIENRSLDTVLPFRFDALTPVSYIAETKNFTELNDFIDKQRKRGSSNINRYLIVAYKRWSLPISAFILTLIAVSVSSAKRRGGMGINLAVGIALAFSFVFIDKIFGTIAEESTFSPLLAVWLPNITFGILSIYLLQKARK
jgi:lipopolysaccharide export system permease protein